MPIYEAWTAIADSPLLSELYRYPHTATEPDPTLEIPWDRASDSSITSGRGGRAAGRHRVR
ncbi:hypothetical protein GCM10010198_00940 [Nocardia seriolae]|nr:hypothetical protein NSER024013_54300 [Nocardia seriolae]GEM27332.1 hypothetical protein NS2_55710 [Nocardia seriolae NBRC 15557]